MGLMILVNDNVSKGNASVSIEKDKLLLYSGAPKKEIHVDTAKLRVDNVNRGFPALFINNNNIFRFIYTIWEYEN